MESHCHVGAQGDTIFNSELGRCTFQYVLNWTKYHAISLIPRLARTCTRAWERGYHAMCLPVHILPITLQLCTKMVAQMSEAYGIVIMC